jgi:hypothetical protein
MPQPAASLTPKQLLRGQIHYMRLALRDLREALHLLRAQDRQARRARIQGLYSRVGGDAGGDEGQSDPITGADLAAAADDLDQADEQVTAAETVADETPDDDDDESDGSPLSFAYAYARQAHDYILSAGNSIYRAATDAGTAVATQVTELTDAAAANLQAAKDLPGQVVDAIEKTIEDTTKKASDGLTLGLIFLGGMALLSSSGGRK